MSKKHFLERQNNYIDELSEELKVDIDKSTFCILPFSHLSTTTTGEIRLCCRSRPIGNIKDGQVLEYWNSPKMKNIRENFIKGVKVEECATCWRSESMGIVSLRNSQNVSRIADYGNNVGVHLKDQNLTLPTLELKLSNRCNLKCKMCSPAASTKWVKSWENLKSFYEPEYQNWIDRVIAQNDLQKNPSLDLYLSNTQFMENFSKFVSDLRMLDFAGGEPLIDPLHYKILEEVIKNGKPEETTLRYSTNLTILSFEKFQILDFWSQFKEVHLTISIDGFSELNEYIRFGTKSEDLKKNIEAVKKIKQVKSIKGTTTLNAYNSIFVDKTIDYIVGDLGIAWHSSRVTSPDFLDARIWSDEIKIEAIRRAKSVSTNKYDINGRSAIQLDRQINDFVQWMETQRDFDQSLINRFWQYTEASDKENRQSFNKLLSDFERKVDPSSSIG